MRRSSSAQRTFRRRRLTALLAAAVLVAAVIVVAAAPGSGHGGKDRPASGSGRHSATPATRSASSTTPARASSTTQAQSSAPSGSAPYRVGITSLTLDEPATGATATGHASSGAPIRTLPTIVRYPAQGPPDAGAHRGARPASSSGPFPLIVFSQGYDVSAEAYAWLLDAWARAGYVVADPTYPRTDPSMPEGVNEADIVHHPGDLRFVISALLAGGRHRSSVLHGLVDPGRVGIVGHSDGGDVTLAVADNSCCRDSVVKAAVILSGAELAAFGGRYDGAGSVPLLVVQGSADTVNVPGCSAQIYDGAPRPRYYLNIAGAEHQPPYLAPGAERGGVARTVIAFFNAFLTHRPAHLQALVRRRNVTGGETLTTAPLPAGTSTYCPGAP